MSTHKSIKHTIILVIFTMIQVTVMAAPLLAGEQVAQSRYAEVVTGNNAFAVDLYKKITSIEKDKNVFFSPFSLSTALAMTYAGSRGETEKQMAATLHFNLPHSDLHEGFSSLFAQINGTAPKAYQLTIANALWGQQGYSFKNTFIDLMKKNYEGGFNTVDFVKETEKSRQTINTWVANKTADKIKELLQRGDITFDAREDLIEKKISPYSMQKCPAG